MGRRQPHRRTIPHRDHRSGDGVLPHPPDLAEQVRARRTEQRLGPRQIRLRQRLVAEHAGRAGGALVRAHRHQRLDRPARDPERHGGDAACEDAGHRHRIERPGDARRRLEVHERDRAALRDEQAGHSVIVAAGRP
jgi:hypothetical protein